MDSAGFEVRSKDVPRCPQCGWQLVLWVRNDTFLQGAAWREGLRRYGPIWAPCSRRRFECKRIPDKHDNAYVVMLVGTYDGYLASSRAIN